MKNLGLECGDFVMHTDAKNFKYIYFNQDLDMWATFLRGFKILFREGLEKLLQESHDKKDVGDIWELYHFFNCLENLFIQKGGEEL
jgi:hypothetical protein